MRTTIAIQDDLLRDARHKALERHSTLSRLIEDLLRVALSRSPSPPANASRVHLKTFHGQGLRPGVDLDSSAALLDVMESR
jgi:hypothetical protein